MVKKLYCLILWALFFLVVLALAAKLLYVEQTLLIPSLAAQRV